MTEHAPELDVTHARQARRGRHALMILAWSLALGLISLAVVLIFYSGSLARLHNEKHDRTHEAVQSLNAQSADPARQAQNSGG